MNSKTKLLLAVFIATALTTVVIGCNSAFSKPSKPQQTIGY